MHDDSFVRPHLSPFSLLQANTTFRFDIDAVQAFQLAEKRIPLQSNRRVCVELHVSELLTAQCVYLYGAKRIKKRNEGIF